jgi:putative addiction module killer protein
VKKIETTPEFTKAFKEFTDMITKAKIIKEIEKIENETPSDTKHLGDRLLEARIHYKAGYRLYYTERQEKLVILLIVGIKRDQQSDIEKARKIIERMFGR